MIFARWEVVLGFGGSCVGLIIYGNVFVKKRWPALALEIESYNNQPHEEWRVFYIKKHNEMAGKAKG